MYMLKSLMASVALVAAPTIACAQSTIATPQVATIAPHTSSVLAAGTPVPLLLLEELTTKEKKLKVGRRFNLEVAADVMLNGQIVIPAGSPAVGEVTDVRNKGMWGKSGKINARILSARVGDRQIRLTGQFDDKGVTGTAGVAAAVVFVPVVGFFVTGTSANIPKGTPIGAFLDEDIRIEPVAAVAAPPG